MVCVSFVILEGSLVKKCAFKTVLPTRKVSLDPRKTLQPLTQWVVNFTQNLKIKKHWFYLVGLYNPFKTIFVRLDHLPPILSPNIFRNHHLDYMKTNKKKHPPISHMMDFRPFFVTQQKKLQDGNPNTQHTDLQPKIKVVFFIFCINASTVRHLK